MAGTVHWREPGRLRLTAFQNIPPKVCEIVAWVPDGKGMAGLALVTKQPVTTCNLKDNTSASVRPGVRAVDAPAAVALPMLSEGNVVAVVGVAWSDSRELSKADLQSFQNSLVSLPASAN